MKARMMFHTKDNNDVAIKRKCIGTNTCQLTIQAIEKVDTRRGIRGGEGSDESQLVAIKRKCIGTNTCQSRVAQEQQIEEEFDVVKVVMRVNK